MKMRFSFPQIKFDITIIGLAVTLLVSISGCDGIKDESQTEAEKVEVKEFSLETVRCWFRAPKRAPDTSCYFMHVPQDYQKLDGLWVRFPVVKLGAKEPQEGKSPVLHLGGGGPGNPIGFNPEWVVSWVWNLYQGMSVDNHRDLYIIDPRGVGNAIPALNCYEYADMVEEVLGENLTNEEENMRSLDAYQLCADRLITDGVDLSQYNSATVAKDMEALRKALDISQWNLYGVSYGTRYAQTMARDFPHTVESMVLDAATFMNINYTERSGEAFLQTLERLFVYCENEAACKAEVGNVRQRFWALVDQLELAPPVFVIKHPYRNEKLKIALTGGRFLNAYYNALYDASAYADLPKVIDSLESKRLGIFKNALYEWVSYIVDREYADGVAHSHYCYEDAPFVDFEAAINNTAILPKQIRAMAVNGLIYTKKQCSNWDVEQAKAIEHQPVKTSIPTLFLHGALDPVLPVEDLQDQSAHFKNSEQVIFDDISHGIVGNHPCGIDLAREFYDHKLKFRDSITCL